MAGVSWKPLRTRNQFQQLWWPVRAMLIARSPTDTQNKGWQSKSSFVTLISPVTARLSPTGSGVAALTALSTGWNLSDRLEKCCRAVFLSGCPVASGPWRHANCPKMSDWHAAAAGIKRRATFDICWHTCTEVPEAWGLFPVFVFILHDFLIFGGFLILHHSVLRRVMVKGLGLDQQPPNSPHLKTRAGC